MNGAAVFLGLLFGVVSAVVFYAVAMLTSGLFARPFYRLYARVLIGICCIMLAAPGLRWLATEWPLLGFAALALAQYLTAGMLFYGVYRFNRDYLQRVFLKRSATAYFTFGTLANAAVVTLAFLQISISGSPARIEQDEHFYVDAAGYGPLILLLAAMVFHTDYHLKVSLRNMRRFSRFTFVGYAISFVGISLSMLPYLGNALAELGLSPTDWLLLQNASSVQTLLIAIVLYAWLVWRYESIPPLFLLLLALIGEYHVLVTQWSVRWFGPASWGLASLPLFVGLSTLNEYFTSWDRRKRKSRGEQAAAGANGQSEGELRFAVPFQVVHLGLGIALIGLTLWTRFAEFPAEAPGWLSSVWRPPTWLGVTFGAYAIYFFGLAFFRQQAQLVYVGGTLGALAALLGFQTPGEPMSLIVLAGLSLTWGGLAFLGDRFGLKQAWRTSLTDCSFLSAIVVTVIVLSRHVWQIEPYYFQTVSFLDGTALVTVVLAFVCCTHQYRSWLPMFGGVIALATIAPTFSAGLGFLAATCAALAERWLPKENVIALENRVLFLNHFPLPWQDVLPQLYVRSLSIGAIPLALVGLLVSAAHVLLGDFSIPVLVGAASSSLVLGLLTRTERVPWLYVVSLVAAYFSLQATAHGYFFRAWAIQPAISAHLLLAVMISLVGWSVARVHALWCQWMLARVAEDQESAIRERRDFYSGWLQSVTSFVCVAALATVALNWFNEQSQPEWSLVTAALLALFFGLAAAVYRSQVGSYLSLTAMTVAVLSALSLIELPPAVTPVALAGLGVLGATLSFALWGWGSSKTSLNRIADEGFPLPGRVPLPAQGLALWLLPLAVYACLCSLIAVATVQQPNADDALAIATSRTAVLAYSLASVAIILSTRALRFTALYLSGVAMGFIAAHATMQAVLFGDQIGSEVLTAQLVLGSALCLAACCLATCYSGLINVRLRSPGEDQADALLENRSFYAGLLQHFTLSICLVLLGLMAVTAWKVSPSEIWVVQKLVAGSLLLSVALAFSGAVYRSRVQSYLVLGAICLAVSVCVATFVPPAVRQTYQDVLLAATALAFGLASWLMGKPKQPDSENVTQDNWPLPSCWKVLPLPLVSHNRELWAKPLAHVSILVTIMAVANSLRNWGQGEPWLFAAVCYLAAITWFLATRTYRLGVLGTLVLDKSSNPAWRQAAERIERSLLFLGCVLAIGVALHTTVDQLLAGLSQQLATSWHMLLAGALALMSWGVATAYSFRLRMRLKDKSLSESSRAKMQDDAGVYAGLLYHAATASALTIFGMALFFGLPPHHVSFPLLGAIGLLVVFFGLAATAYRSLLGNYLSLSAVGLAILHLTAMANLNRASASLDWEAEAFSLLGLVLMIVAGFFSRPGAAEPAERPRLLPSEWSAWPLSVKFSNWQSLWQQPLRDASICYAILGLFIILLDVTQVPGADWVPARTLIACLASAATFVLAARRFNSALPTYVAAFMLTVGIIPLLMVLGSPFIYGGVAMATLAMLLWNAGFVVERFCVGKLDAVEPESPFIKIYERPLIRSSAVLATFSIASGVMASTFYDWDVSQQPLVMACVVAAATLLLGARFVRGAATIPACTTPCLPGMPGVSRVLPGGGFHVLGL